MVGYLTLFITSLQASGLALFLVELASLGLALVLVFGPSQIQNHIVES